MDATIFTIGHSNLELDNLRAALREFAIEAVVDVRSQPVSTQFPQFNKNELAASLKQSGIAYAFMGQELGGRPENRRYYDEHGRVRYDLWSQDELFQTGLGRLIKASTERRSALLCAEEDPTSCHRHLLIARALTERGFPADNILHIRAFTTKWQCVAENEIPRQAGLLGEEADWKSPQSVLHKVLPRTSSNGSDGLESAGWSTFD